MHAGRKGWLGTHSCQAPWSSRQLAPSVAWPGLQSCPLALLMSRWGVVPAPLLGALAFAVARRELVCVAASAKEMLVVSDMRGAAALKMVMGLRERKSC